MVRNAVATTGSEAADATIVPSSDGANRSTNACVGITEGFGGDENVNEEGLQILPFWRVENETYDRPDGRFVG